MRINEKSDSRSIAKKEKGTAPKSVAGTSAPLFAGRLAAIAKSSTEYEGELQRLKEEIDKAGDVLEQEPTIANFKVFRELIGTMARKVSAEAYRIEMLSGGVTGRSHEVISVIDKEADLLYHLVMREQKDHIRIVAQIIKIKGLVVDFLL
ncbi:YaaR family protein [Geomonas anaerohicana]|uniref:YaaR family protein n=1 Tax=Geomonas anaerohicana TaxID=2798583 RepID=A0ABS0YEX8_9BACT|nr:YaaR family protein [Geomonas anaerohicana]MBJ6750843.1 YaaR family protein [Geomonas anaerohicana]